MNDQRPKVWADSLDRLWAPHRLAYIRGGEVDVEPGCPFCRVQPGTLSADGDTGLVVARGEWVYAMLNLYPYNPAHLMVIPYRHVADYTALGPEETAEFTAFTQRAVRTIRRISEPQGFNIGMNLGGVAGGSLADHLHQHVVPRWSGDANFMTITAGTKVLPQLLTETAHLLNIAWTEE